MTTKFIKLKPSQIGTDLRFQRDFDESRAKAMARKLDRDLLGVFVVSRRSDGTYVFIDAQHRGGACKIAGYDELTLCEVHDGLSLQEEAALFLRLNGGRRPIRIFDKFKAQLVAKEPVAVEITAMLKTVGLRISKTPAKNGVMAIQALVGVYHKRNLPGVLDVLMAWSDGDAPYLEGSLIKALSSFLSAYPDIDRSDFAKRLRQLAADRVLSKLKRTHDTWPEYSSSLAACIVFREIYNERRQKKTRLPAPAELHDDVAEAAE